MLKELKKSLNRIADSVEKCEVYAEQYENDLEACGWCAQLLHYVDHALGMAEVLHDRAEAWDNVAWERAKRDDAELTRLQREQAGI